MIKKFNENFENNPINLERILDEFLIECKSYKIKYGTYLIYDENGDKFLQPMHIDYEHQSIGYINNKISKSPNLKISYLIDCIVHSLNYESKTLQRSTDKDIRYEINDELVVLIEKLNSSKKRLNKNGYNLSFNISENTIKLMIFEKY